jgi:hypothetical protein
MQVVRENPTLEFSYVAGNACATGISAIHMQRITYVVDVEAVRALRPETPRAASESRFLAMKKFFDTNSLCLAGDGRSRLLGPTHGRDDSALATFCQERERPSSGRQRP